VAKAKFEGARIATIDGLRADWPDGWGLVRASNTTPVLVLRFDAKDANALARVQQAFREQIAAVNPNSCTEVHRANEAGFMTPPGFG